MTSLSSFYSYPLEPISDYNLYQSQVRQDIQSKIYRKPTFKIHLFGQDYFWVIKKKHLWPLSIQWFQVMWVFLPDDLELIHSELDYIKKKYSNKYWNICFQLWINNTMIRFFNNTKKTEWFEEEVKNMRLDLREKVCKEFWLKVAFRENMPESNIVYELDKSDEEILKWFNDWARQKVRKWLSHWVEFSVATPEEHSAFYQKWSKVSQLKWFTPITRREFEALMRYFDENKNWDLFVTKHEWEIIAWSVCAFDWKTMIYLYWFSERWNNAYWWQQFLKYKAFCWARDNWYARCDMMWWAPTWFPDHPLTWVSAFKESLWWEKIEQWGSYDLVLNPILYKCFDMYTWLRHKKH